MAFASHNDNAETRGGFREEAGVFLAAVFAPGYRRHQLEVEVAGHTVTIQGEKAGSIFKRKLDLPPDADPDELTASLAQSVLRLRARHLPPHRRSVPVEDGESLIHAEAAAS